MTSIQKRHSFFYKTFSSGLHMTKYKTLKFKKYITYHFTRTYINFRKLVEKTH